MMTKDECSHFSNAAKWTNRGQVDNEHGVVAGVHEPGCS